MENETIQKYQDVIQNVENDIAEAETFKKDLQLRYDVENNSVDEVIKIQSMILKISDYISQKRMTKVELERQLLELQNTIKGE